MIAKSVDIRAETGAEIRGRGTGSTIKILASDVKLTGLTVTGFGREILSQDAGIHIRKFAHDITITGVTVTGPGVRRVCRRGLTPYGSEFSDHGRKERTRP